MERKITGSISGAGTILRVLIYLQTNENTSFSKRLGLGVTRMTTLNGGPVYSTRLKNGVFYEHFHAKYIDLNILMQLLVTTPSNWFTCDSENLLFTRAIKPFISFNV